MFEVLFLVLLLHTAAIQCEKLNANDFVNNLLEKAQRNFDGNYKISAELLQDLIEKDCNSKVRYCFTDDCTLSGLNDVKRGTYFVLRGSGDNRMAAGRLKFNQIKAGCILKSTGAEVNETFPVTFVTKNLSIHVEISLVNNEGIKELMPFTSSGVEMITHRPQGFGKREADIWQAVNLFGMKIIFQGIKDYFKQVLNN